MTLGDGGRRLLGRIPLAVRMGFIALLMGGGVWLLLQGPQEQELRALFEVELQEQLEQVAAEDRRRFDAEVQRLRHAARLIASQQRFLDHVEGLRATGGVVDHHTLPPWLPEPSLMRAFFNARHAILVGPEGEVREIYHHLAHLDGADVAEPLRNPSPLLRRLSHNQAYITKIDGYPHVVAAAEVRGRDGEVTATLLLESPIDDELLRPVTHGDRGRVVALADVHGRIVASTEPARVPAGSDLDGLRRTWLAMASPFFDYGASDVRLRIVTLVPMAEVERMTQAVLVKNHRQRLILVGAMFLAFLLLTTRVAMRINRLGQAVSRFTRQRLEATPEDAGWGDEIAALGCQFDVLQHAVARYQERLEGERRLLANFPERNPHPVLRIGRGGVIQYANEVARPVLRAWRRQVGEPLPDGWLARIERGVGECGAPPLEVAAEGRCYLFLPALAEDGFVYLYGRDHTAERRAERDLQTAAAVAEHVLDAIMVTDRDGVIRQVNPAFTDIMGYTPDEVIGKTPQVFKSDHHDEVFYGELWRTLLVDSQWRGEIWNRRKNGESFPCLVSINAIRNGHDQIVRFVAVYSDISERRAREEQLSEMAYRDPLTGLPNRSLLHDRLAQEIAHAARRASGLAVLYLDLDGFKAVNDTLGHAAGDWLLRDVAARLRGAVRRSDVVARVGGDEFVVVLLDPALVRPGGREEVGRVADKICHRVAEPYTVDGRAVRIGASIGIAFCPGDGDTPEALLECADRAMYAAKQSGKNGWAFHRTGDRPALSGG